MTTKNSLNVALITASGLIAWLLNYAYHPLMLKYISIEDFWIFGSLVWIFNILWVLITGLVLFLNKQVSTSCKDMPRVKHIFIDSLKIFLFIWLLFYVIYILFTPLINNFLKIDDIYIIIIVWVTIIIWFIRAVVISIIRWIKAFSLLALEWIITPLIKLFLWFILVLYGYSYYGAIIWFLISWIIMIVFLVMYILNHFKGIKKNWSTKELLVSFYEDKKEITHFFIISLFFAIFMNIDVILVRNIFNEQTSWIYAWISILGKFLIFLLFSIETVYYGQIMEYPKNVVPSHLIKTPIKLIIIISFLALIVNYLIWWYVLRLLKEEFTQYLDIYILILVSYSLLAFISFFTKVLIGWKKYYINTIMCFFTILLIFLVYFLWQDSLKSFIYCFIFIWMLTTITISSIFYKEWKN